MKHLALVCAILGLLPVAVARASDADILIEFGALRARNGLPPVTEVPELSAGCRALMAYRAANGGTVGNRADWPEAAKKLAWWVDAREWGLGGPRPTAQWPNADAGLVTPMAERVGVGDGCLGFGGPWRAQPENAALVPFPGDGSSGTPYEERAWREFPQGNLSQYLGGPEQSGPYLRVFAWGGGFARAAPGRVEADVTASLVDDQGRPMSVRVGANGALAGWSSTGTAVIVPTDPLAPRSWYTASVSYRERVSGVSASRTWRFRTAGRPAGTVVDVTLGGRLLVSTDSPASVWVSLRRGGRRVELGPFGRGASSVAAPVAPGGYRMCIDQNAVGPYDGVDTCRDVQRSWAAPVSFRATRLRSGRIRLRASAPRVAAGLLMRARVVALRINGRWVRTSRGGRVVGRLGRRSRSWVLTRTGRLDQATAIRVRSATGTAPALDGQSWLAAPQTTVVAINHR